MTDLQTWTALLRAAHLVGLLGVLGSVVFLAFGQRQLSGREADFAFAPVRGLVAPLAVIGVVGGLCWGASVAAGLAQGGGTVRFFAFFSETRLGLYLLSTCFLLIAAAVAAGAVFHPLAGLAAVAAVVLHGLTTHPTTMGASWLTVLSGLGHLIAAGIWLGSLVPLLIAIRRLPPRGAADLADSYALLAAPCVGLIALTALIQGQDLIGDLPHLIGTPYGQITLLKGLGLCALVACAAVNRLAGVKAARRGSTSVLTLGIGVETVIGLGVVGAAGFLAGHVPAVHEQPVWPWPWTIDFSILRVAPVRDEAVAAFASIAAASLLIVAALWLRALRLPALVLACLVGFLGLYGRAGLVVVPAQRTSYFEPPAGPTLASLARGGEVYRSACAACHGPNGWGDGPEASAQPVPPADLTAGHFWDHRPGELYGWVNQGIRGLDGSLSMPGFADRLSEDDIWDVLDFLRARAAGVESAVTGGWLRGVQAPEFPVSCAESGAVPSTTLGKPIRLVFKDRVIADQELAQDAAMADRVVPVWALAEAVPAPQSACHAGPEIRAAFSDLTGLPQSLLGESQILIGADGILRGRFLEGDLEPGSDAADFAARVVQICTAPPASGVGGHAGHHH